MRMYCDSKQRTMRRSSAYIGVRKARNRRFFPSPPHIPPMPGTVCSFDMSGVLDHATEDQSHANWKNDLRAVHERLYILCSGDQNGIICLSAFGVFPIEHQRLDYKWHECGEAIMRTSGCFCFAVESNRWICPLESLQIMACAESRASGLYAISVDTSLLGDRRKELLQVALQASSVEELLEVVEATVIVMRKH